MMEYDPRPMAGRKRTGGATTRRTKGEVVQAEVGADDGSEGERSDEAEAEEDLDAAGEPKAEELEEVAVDDALPVIGSEETHETPAIETEPATGRSERGSIVRHDPMTAYVQEIRRVPLLTREQEHELAVKFAKTGDPALAHRMVTANLRLVVKIAHEYRRAYKNLLDLVQEGNIGLMQ